MKLSDKIALLRKEKGWSQEQLAINLEVSRQAVYKWEADINQPDLDKLKKIAHLFNVSFNELMDDEVDLSTRGQIPNEIIEIEDIEIPHVEIIENVTDGKNGSTGTVHNEVEVQINYNKESKKPPNKRLIVSLCIFIGVAVVSISVLCYIIFGIILQRDSYLVKFDSTGGTVVGDLIIKEGKEIDEFSPPTKKGYTFDGWYIGDKKWDFSADKIKNNTTLTAKWTPNKNTIYFIDNNTGERYESFALTDETVILSPNTFKKDGYTFKGWATSPNSEIAYSNCDSFKMGAESMTLYAVWESDEYTLTLNVGDGIISGSVPSTFTSNDKISLPTPSLEHFAFDGWYDEDGKKYDSVPKGTTSDLTLTAKYTRLTYSITYELDGGINDEDNPDSYTSGVETYIYPPSKEGFSFAGWFLDEDFTEEFDGYLSGFEGMNITLYASWASDYFEFEEVSGGFALVYYEGVSETVVIPETYLYGDVIEISALAFYGNEYMCEVVIPSTVKHIDTSAFNECYSLSTITVDKDNQSYTDIDGVLFNKSETWLYKYPMAREDTIYVAPSSVDVIGSYAFSYAVLLEEVYLPNDPTLTYGIGKVCEGAFEGCLSLSHIELGYIANYFEARCFSNCWSLESIEFKAETIWGIGNNAFECCLLLEDVIFNCGSVKSIGDSAFLGCLSLSTLDLTVVEKLGSQVFMESGITELYIPLGVTSIGKKLFLDCLGEELTVYCEASEKPSGWASDWDIGAFSVIWNGGEEPPIVENTKFTYALNGYNITITKCEGTGTVTIPSTIDGYTVTTIGANAFSGQDEITKVILPSTVTSVDKTAFDGCISLESFEKEGGYAKIRAINGILYDDWGNSIIRYPEGRTETEFTVPSSVDIIRAYAFKGNVHLTKITLPSDVSGDNYVGKLEQGAFEGCTSLTTVNGLAANYLERDVFRNCISLESIKFLSDEVYGIGNYSFLNCSSLETVEFKGNVSAIGYQVFGYCTNLQHVKFGGTLGSFGMHTFENCVSLPTIYLPEGLTVLPSEAFKGCYSLVEIIIPSTLTTIEDYALLGTSLKYFNIPSHVTTVEDYAFSGLAEIILFCEENEKPIGWDDKWNYKSENEETTHPTYFGELYQEPSYYYTTSNDKATITSIKQITSKILIIPSTLGLSPVTDIHLTDTDLSGVEHLYLPSNVDSTVFSFNLMYFNNLKSVNISIANRNLSSVDGVAYSYDKSELIFYPRKRDGGEYVAIKELKTIKKDAFEGCKNLTSLILYSDTECYGVEKIEDDAFSLCTNLSSVYFGNKITEIGTTAFNECTSLKSLEFTNEGKLTVRSYAFYKCSALESITFKGSESILMDYAFHLCENVSALNLKDVSSIGNNTFSANSLRAVFIPSSVTQISVHAFDDASNVTFYCQPTEKPAGWSDTWVPKTDSVQILWSQSGLPNND